MSDINDTKRDIIINGIIQRKNELLVNATGKLNKQQEKLEKLLDNRGKSLLFIDKKTQTSTHIQSYFIQDARFNDNGQIEVHIMGGAVDTTIKLDDYDITIINSVEHI